MNGAFRRRPLLLGGAALLALPWSAGARAAEARHPAAARGAKPAKGHSASDIPSTTVDTPAGPLDVTARWAYVTDVNTGTVLLDKDGDEPMPPSSMTKLMTLYIVYSQLKSGKLKLDQTLPVSERAWRTGGSRMFVQVGTNVSIEDLIRGIVVDSGNDACIVIAEGIAGSEEGFVEQMNQQAKKLGLTQTQFRNCTGLPDPDHHMSCRDIAVLAGVIIREFPEYYHFNSEKTFKYNNIEQENRNPLVDRGVADGLKTGHTDAGGFGVVASTERNGRRVIIVINGLPTSHARAEEAELLLDWCFRVYEDVTLFTAADTVENAPVWLGTQSTVPLVGGKNLVMTMPRNWRQKATVSVQYQSPIPAPISRGDAVGKITVSGDGIPSVELPLLAGADVPRLSLPGRAVAVLAHFVTGS
jgi:D-alanyl-D-alanine carboxypeptidase (penicillin-binding protein 5/6)